MLSVIGREDRSQVYLRRIQFWKTKNIFSHRCVYLLVIILIYAGLQLSTWISYHQQTHSICKCGSENPPGFTGIQEMFVKLAKRKKNNVLTHCLLQTLDLLPNLLACCSKEFVKMRMHMEEILLLFCHVFIKDSDYMQSFHKWQLFLNTQRISNNHKY